MIKGVKPMRYSDIILDQIDLVRQVRNDNVDKYPRVIETLWLLMRNPEGIKQINEKKQEFKVKPSHTIEVPDLELWDAMFSFTLDVFQDYEGVNIKNVF